MKLEISNMLTISTAHIKHETRECLDNTDSISGTIDNTFYHLNIYNKGEFGWFIYIIPDTKETYNVNMASELITHPDLTDCIKLAIRHNCNILCFDRDGEIYNNILPTFEK